MKLILYRIYQFCIMMPLLLVATVLAATLTILATFLGGARWWGYQIPKYWGRIFCALTLVKVEVRGRDNISQGQSYVFVANHQGAYDIFSIYGYLGHNFRWMMKKSLEKIPLVGFSCKVSGHIFVDNSSPHAIKETMVTAENALPAGCRWWCSPKVHALSTAVSTASNEGPISSPRSSISLLFPSLSTEHIR